MCRYKHLFSNRRFRSLMTSGSAGFSLIEMLVVVVLLGLIASIVAPNMLGKIADAKSKTARVQIEDLAAAVELYFLDTGSYPASDVGLDALINAPAEVPQWDGPYLKKKRIPDDPWRRPYLYRSPGEFAPFEIWSLGADQKVGGDGDNADVESWQ